MEQKVRSDQTEEDPSSTPAVHMRVYRAGVIAGMLAFVALLGVIKDVYALLKPSGRGQLILGFLMVRYSSLERVWFGYRFTGHAAWLATFPHLVVYAAAVYGLISLRRWGWYLVFGYVLYIPLSECTFMLLYPLGYLTNHPYAESVVRAEWFFFLVSVPLELLAAGLLWWYRDLFVR